jgi:RimJ/RimL family protein N-acetyltransferase
MMAKSIKIRQYRKNDFKQFLQNEQSYYNELKTDPRFPYGIYGEKKTKKSIRKSFLNVLKLQRSGKCGVFVAENKEGKIVGEMVIDGTYWPDGPHIADLACIVVKGYRKKGVATLLLKYVLKKYRKKYEIFTASIFSNNTGSRALLKKFGFKGWGIGPKFVKRGKLYFDDEHYYLKLK